MKEKGWGTIFIAEQDRDTTFYRTKKKLCYTEVGKSHATLSQNAHARVLFILLCAKLRWLANVSNVSTTPLSDYVTFASQQSLAQRRMRRTRACAFWDIVA